MTSSVCIHSECMENGDYYEAAKIKCEKSGGHLATLAELKIAYDNGFITSTENWAWASEERSDKASYCLTKTGSSYTCLKNYNDRQLFCIDSY